MKKIYLDEYTQAAATDYANNQAELDGFEIGGPEWKRAFKKYLGFAVGTMSVGRNPRRLNPRDMGTWPEIFSGQGFAGEVARKYKGKDGETHSLTEIQERIRSSVTALAYMYLNGIYGIKTTTKTGKSGKISASEMSEIQLRGSEPGLSKEEADAENVDIAWNQLALTVIESALYEYLLPFFTMKPEDVAAILDKMQMVDDGKKITAASMAVARTEAEKAIRRVVGNKLTDMNFKKLVLG